MIPKVFWVFVYFFLIVHLSTDILCGKSKKEVEPDYYDKSPPSIIPPTLDLKRCSKNQEDCIEYEFFTYSIFLEPNSSQKAKKAQFNRWLRHNNFSGFNVDHYTNPEKNYSQLRLFSSKNERVELFLNESQYFHDDSYNMKYFKDTYLIYMHFQHGKMDFKAKINKFVLGILYHTAYCLDSMFEEWIHLLPQEHKGLLVTLRSDELELLKDEREAYKLAKEKRKEYINDYYDFVGLVHEKWMSHHPQMVKDYFRRDNVTMSDFIWARHLVEVRKIEVESEGRKKVVILPFLEFSGLQALTEYEKVVDNFQINPSTSNIWFDSEHLHLVLENLGDMSKNGIFHESLLNKPKHNYYFMLMYGFVPEKNFYECIQTLIIPNEIARKIPRSIFGWLIQLNYPGTGICMKIGMEDIQRKLQFLGFFINLSPEEMENLFEVYRKELEENPDEDKFNLAFKLIPKPKVLKLDFRPTSFKSIEEFENKKKLNLERVEEFIKTHGNNERVEMIKQYYDFYLKLANSVRTIIQESMEGQNFAAPQEPEEKKADL